MSAQTYIAPVIADLEARAGASDKDRELWLAERRQGVTATEIRDMYLEAHGRRSWTTKQGLIDRKLGRVAEVEDLSNVPVVGWGNYREGHIAEQLRGEGFRPESRVFHHPENSRYLASPDGIAVDFDEQIDVLEIKTAAYDLPPGSLALDRKGYAIQVQWVMFVIGARRCRFVVEERITTSDGFEPGELHRHWIERDDVLIAELVKLADEFLAELDRQRDEGAPEIDEDVDTHAVNYLRGLAAEKEGKALKEASYKALLAAKKSQTSALARVTYTPPKPGVTVEVEEVDYRAAEAAAPELLANLRAAQKVWDDHCQAFTKTVESTGPASREKVTVTAVKHAKESKA
ncbi:YqaJ viral recombinase family protein [Microbacterium sp. KNMS]